MAGPSAVEAEVRVGQVWADLDKRSTGRHVRVIEIEPAEEGHRGRPARAVVVPCTRGGVLLNTAAASQRQTRIRLDRFRPTSTGYRLVLEAPDQA